MDVKFLIFAGGLGLALGYLATRFVNNTNPLAPFVDVNDLPIRLNDYSEESLNPISNKTTDNELKEMDLNRELLDVGTGFNIHGDAYIKHVNIMDYDKNTPSRNWYLNLNKPYVKEMTMKEHLEYLRTRSY